MQEYYQILGLEESASKQDIQDAYDKLSVELDPKNNDDLDFFKEEFSLLQEAYEKLMGHLPESIDSDSSEEIVETQKFDANSGKRALGDDETTLSLFKKYVNTDKQGKKEMVEVLEELQNHDKKYLDALQLIYKTEGVESFKEFIAKQSNKKKETSPKQQEPSKSSNAADKLPKSNVKKKKIIFSLAILSVVVIFYLFYNREVKGCMDPTAFNYNPKANTSAKCIPIIKGCTDSKSINYNSKSNVMLDRSCIKVEYRDNNKSSLIYFDLAKYKDVRYDFIYNISDTISDTYDINYSNNYYYRNIIINKIDTISYTPYNVDENHLSSRSFPQGNRIKVIEYLSGKRKKTHYIDILEGEYLLNPLSYYKYKFEEAQYGSLALGFGSRPNYRKGFLVLLEDKIDFWFKDFPQSITVQQYEYSLDLYYRHNITRYR